MKTRFLIQLALSGLLAVQAHAETVLIKGAKVHTLSGIGTLEEGDVLVRDGKIQAVAASIDEAADRVIDARGKVVTPGVIAPHSELGLTEIGAASATNDYAVTGESIGSSFDPRPAYNPKSTLIPYNRAHGVTRAVVFPSISTWGEGAGELHRVFAGQGFAIALNGEFDSVVSEEVGQRAYLGEIGGQLAGGSRANAYARIQQALSEAREYLNNRQAIRSGNWRELNHSLADLEALFPVLQGQQPLIVTANRASDILQALELAQEYQLRLVIHGAAEGWMVASELAAAKVPVILNAIDNRPISFESLGARFDNAARLQRAGVTVAITASGTHLAHLSRQAAGNAVVYGLPYEEALKSISANVARIFGLGAGVLQPGAVADLVVWSGDPLEVTSYPEQVLIAGEQQSLVNRSTRLRDRYLKPEQGHEMGYRF